MIEGGERIRTVAASHAVALPSRRRLELAGARRSVDRPPRPDRLDAATSRPTRCGSSRAAAASEPPAGFDPLLAAVDFSFKVECPTRLRLRARCDCPPEPAEAPRSTTSRRTTSLPRAHARPAQPARAGLDGAQLRPTSASRSSSCSRTSPTSSRTGRTRSRPRRTSRTARRRTSLRRHARLVDYLVHEGCNARAWVRVFVDAGEGVALAAGTPLLTRVPDAAAGARPGRAASTARRSRPAPRRSRRSTTRCSTTSHERFDFWTWGDDGCCLPRGATSATLVGDHPS